jgi:hypothetical protein
MELFEVAQDGFSGQDPSQGADQLVAFGRCDAARFRKGMVGLSSGAWAGSVAR